MICDRLFSEIDKLYETYLGVFEYVCNIESPTNCKEGLDKVGRYFADMAKQHGWQVEIFRQEIAGDVVCITMNPDAQNAPVTLSGHIDTVHALGLFGNPPVKQDEEKFYGPGVFDCKGGVVAAFLAMDALEKTDFKSRPVRLILQTDEETGSVTSNKATVEYMCKKAEGSAAFLNCETHPHNKTMLIRKGIVRYGFTVCGKAAKYPSFATGSNAIAEAAYKIIELEKLKDADGLECNCGTISGGKEIHSVAEECTFGVNVRFTSNEQLEFIRNKINELCNDIKVEGCTCKVRQIGFRDAMPLTQTNLDLLARVNRIYEDNGLEKLDYTMSYGGSDATNITKCGIPCLDSFGVEGGGIHSAQEFAIKKTLAESAKRIAAVVYCI